MSSPSNSSAGTRTESPRADTRTDVGDVERAHAVEVHEERDDRPSQRAWIGTDERGRQSNTAWGAIFAGVVTFLAITVLLNMITAAVGLQGASGTAAGIWAVITLAIAFAAAGFVAGALAVRAGFLHGFLTWATSLIAVLVLVGWLGASLLGAVGNVAGSVAQSVTQGTDVTQEDVQDAAGAVEDNVTQEDAQQAAQDAQDTVAQATDDIGAGMWWAFAGALIGAIIAAFAGYGGAQQVSRKDDESAVVRR